MLLKLLIIPFTILLLNGCGDNSTTTEDTQTTEQTNETVKNSKKVYDNHVQELIDLADLGKFSDVTYICIGDSTRAISDDTHAHRLFERVSNSLDNYNVTSHLQARGSHTLDDFIHENISPTWSETVNLIPSKGEHTIVDISLAVNDLFSFNIHNEDEYPAAKEEIKKRLLRAIKLIKDKKPKTTFFLTSPNPVKEWEEATQVCHDAYSEVAKEEGYLFIDFVDTIMPGYEEDGFLKWYRDGIHFSDYGLNQVSDYILSKILPE